MHETTRWTNLLGAALLLLGAATGIADAHESSLTAADRIEALCRPQIDAPCIARVSASLRSASSGNPLPGKTLRFVAGDTVICTAVTDAAGTTSCFGVARSGRDLAESGYRILFDGDDHFTAGSAITKAAVRAGSNERSRRDF